MKKSLDGKCVFYEKTHKYKIGKTELISVTTFLKSFFEEFDEKKVARDLSKWHPKYKKLGIRKTLKQWKEAAEHGSRTHLLLENWVHRQFSWPHRDFIEEPIANLEDRDMLKYTQGEEWLKTYFKSVGEPNPLTEFIVYDMELGLAGQVDLLVERNDDKNNNVNRVYDIIDYKTNNKIDTSGYKGKKALDPIVELDDCSLVKYTLQLSLYAYMLERRGMSIGNLTLLHLEENKHTAYSITYEKEIVERLIEHGKRKE